MTAREFANKLCAALIARKVMGEDSAAHRTLHGAAQELFPTVQEALREECAKAVDARRALLTSKPDAAAEAEAIAALIRGLPK